MLLSCCLIDLLLDGSLLLLDIAGYFELLVGEDNGGGAGARGVGAESGGCLCVRYFLRYFFGECRELRGRGGSALRCMARVVDEELG